MALLIGILLLFAVVGFLTWLVIQIPMPAPWPRVIVATMIFITMIIVLSVVAQRFGLGNVWLLK